MNRRPIIPRALCPAVMSRIFAILFCVVMGHALLGTAITGSVQAGPFPGTETEVEGLVYTVPFFPGASYDPEIPTPESVLGFSIGERFTSPEEIEQCLRAWDGAGGRTRLVEYARTYEDRPLHYMIVSSPRNMARLDEIKTGLARLADPRDLDDGEARQLLETLPAVGWFAYSIHGNETSGADAALAVLYHLAASTDSVVEGLLDDLVIIIDPLMNPDGRERFYKQTEEHRGAVPNLDSQSLLHRGYWPSGRMNHYLFDLNRDWIFGVHPETRGRMKAVGQWRPMLMVDGHEMGSLDTYLFSPAREPINIHYPERRRHWATLFARDQASAFDEFGWRYYHGEWNDEWYPGYSTWASFRGSLFILYEQARIGSDAVRRPEGTLMTYGESVHHQVVSTVANLGTLQRGAGAMMKEFLKERRRAVSADGPYAERTYILPSSANRGRFQRFIDLMTLQGVAVYTLSSDLETGPVTDQFGLRHEKVTLAAGSLLIPNRQPEAHLVAALLDFDPRMDQETLSRERVEILRRGRSRMYDVTAWNITMLYGLEAFELQGGLPAAAVPWTAGRGSAGGSDSRTGRTVDRPPVAHVFDGADDRSVVIAARLMELGVETRAANKAFTFDGRDYARGSVVITRVDNTRFDGDLEETVNNVGDQLGMKAGTVFSGLGEGELPDLGASRFRLLERPRIALVARGGVSAYDYGAIWHLLDQGIGIRHSHLGEERLTGTDLQRYNVIVLPDRFWGDTDPKIMEALKGWVESGGTLIAIGKSARSLASESSGLSAVRQLPDVLDRLDRYELAVLREFLAREGEPPTKLDVWSHTAEPGLTFPWQEEVKAGPPDVEELKMRDQWLSLFMPQGAVLAARTDDRSWLTFGCGDRLPVLVGGAVGALPVLMADETSMAPVRLGCYMPEEAGGSSAGRSRGKRRGGSSGNEAGPAGGPAKGDQTASAPLNRVGWCRLPEGYEMRLRMSGLLWPEAAHRLANAAYVTRERLGKGQVILFASPPVFRGAALGTSRLLANAMVYGPGYGASNPVIP